MDEIVDIKRVFLILWWAVLECNEILVIHMPVSVDPMFVVSNYLTLLIDLINLCNRVLMDNS